MSGEEDGRRDLARLVVPRCGLLEATGDPFEPYRLVDAHGVVVGPVAVYLRELQACERPATTQRSYGMDLLRWFRFLWAAGIGWDQATRAEARDFCRWIQLAAKPAPGAPRTGGARVRRGGKEAVNPVTGKPAPAVTYAAATRAHSESVLRAFYDLHLEAGTGPMVNPFPLSRSRRGGRANAHHNPAEPYRDERSGRYRPAVVQRMPRCIRRDARSLSPVVLRVAAQTATGPLSPFGRQPGNGPIELLGPAGAPRHPAQLITVIRKGTRFMQQLPASPDAFVWLRLYQAQMEGLVPAGRDQPLWWTLLRPFRRLAYHGAEAMFARANATLGANWTLHDLRHTAAYRMARDPGLPVTDEGAVDPWPRPSVHHTAVSEPADRGRHRGRARVPRPAGAGRPGAAGPGQPATGLTA